jgi:hypothetical protein
VARCEKCTHMLVCFVPVVRLPPPIQYATIWLKYVNTNDPISQNDVDISAHNSALNVLVLCNIVAVVRLWFPCDHLSSSEFWTQSCLALNRLLLIWGIVALPVYKWVSSYSTATPSTHLFHGSRKLNIILTQLRCSWSCIIMARIAVI